MSIGKGAHTIERTRTITHLSPPRTHTTTTTTTQQVECSTVDIWTDFAPWPYNQFVPAYQFMAKNPFYWKAFWEYGK